MQYRVLHYQPNGSASNPVNNGARRHRCISIRTGDRSDNVHDGYYSTYNILTTFASAMRRSRNSRCMALQNAWLCIVVNVHIHDEEHDHSEYSVLSSLCFFFRFPTFTGSGYLACCVQCRGSIARSHDSYRHEAQQGTARARMDLSCAFEQM